MRRTSLPPDIFRHHHQRTRRRRRPARIDCVIACSSIVIAALGMAPGPSAAAGLKNIPVCHGFGCRYKAVASMSESEWDQIKEFFQPPAKSAAQERDQIRRAAGWFEVIMGRHTPIHLDQPGDNYPGRFGTGGQDKTGIEYNDYTWGQQDCVDDSVNMTTYLTLMDKAGLFKYYKVIGRARRHSAFDQHFAGQIENIKTGKRWVVDSWFYGYGNLPVVEPTKKWSDVPFLFGTAW